MKPWNPTSVPAPIGKYSHLIEVDSAPRWIFISGQVGVRTDGSVADTMHTQTLQAFANIDALLDEMNAGPGHIVRLLTFAVGVDDVPDFYRARDEVYARWFPDGLYCGHSLAVVAALARPEIVVEIEGWVAVPAIGTARP
ncbi:RidA family protein [Rhodococcus sp. WWJCD1]|uniref:RidA family protein n=1 Tax=Rhodococcus sp. WWJCD1 TaxID=2022519 RepID=UPI0015960487|nr:RidA family protein [Rhodococcus sp. WWJCD1]